MSEEDYILEMCGHKPDAFLGPGEWDHSDDCLPFEQKDIEFDSYKYTKLEGCYGFCGVKLFLPDGIHGEGYIEDIRFFYVGKAVRLRSRITEHTRSGFLFKFFDWCDEIHYLPMVAFWISKDRNALESHLIKALDPAENKVRNP